MQNNRQKQTWSQSFWREKVIRTLLMLALFAVLVLLWNWDGPNQVETTATNNTDIEQTVPDPPQIPENPTVPEVVQPAAPAFPYEISLPEGTGNRVDVGTDAQPAYEYSFTDGATMTVYPEGVAAFPADIEWEYTSDANGSVTVVERLDQLCSAGTTGCSAGNGRIEITVVPSAAADQLVIFIDDDNIATKTPAQAAQQYEAIVNTVRLVR